MPKSRTRAAVRARRQPRDHGGVPTSATAPTRTFALALSMADQLLNVDCGLDAELMVSALLGASWQSMAGTGLDPDWVFTAGLIDYAARRPTPASLALLTAGSRERENWGRLRGKGLGVGRVGKAGVPAAEVVGEVVVEHAGADLKEQVRAARRPPHLLVLHHPFADDLVDGGLGEGTGDGLPGPVTLPVVGDAGGVGPQVAAELADRFAQLALLGTGVVDVEVDLDVLDGLQGAEDVAVPAEPLEPGQLLA